MDKPLIDEIRKLSLEERVQLAGAIWDSIANDSHLSLNISKQAVDELERRWLAHQAAPDEAIPWEEVQRTLGIT